MTPCGGTGEIVVERFFGVPRVQPADSEQQPEKFLVFGVHADNGIGRIPEFLAVLGDDLELPVAASMLPQRQ